MATALSLASPLPSFSSPRPASFGPRHAPSIRSSLVTDIASEGGDAIPAEEQIHAVSLTTGLSNDPNRPGSAMSSQTRPSTRAPPSRRGMGSPSTLSSWRTGGAFGGPGGSITNSSRPPSAASKTSRTHVPSLASHAFFKPMSSQRLQAQRGMRLVKAAQPASSLNGSSDAGSNTQRHSFVSEATGYPGQYLHQDLEVLPHSRGTEFTEQEDRITRDASITENATLQSMGESDRPLQDRSTKSKHTHLDPERRADGSPKSFPATFHQPTNTRKDTQGHEHLSSSNNSPTFIKPIPGRTSQPGINYQYFSGNTVFCLGGRMQNTRDRPVNVMSGIIVILPAVLFLVYSYVQKFFLQFPGGCSC